ATDRQSIIDAGRLRVRPIFLTTVTTVIGILPTAYGLGGLDKFVVPVAMALGWGLFFGSVLTAFVFPSSLAILDDFTALMRRWFPKAATFYDH
ncbi:MAG TPA: efflux RND transporter permease subunit, partial [Bdellovibrionales bacterium]|nr:efflux RND transporter permease subunit [Bdellovibrionales bacterium]